MDKPLSLWGTFFVIFLFLIVLDLGLLSKGQKVVSIKQSLWTSLGYFIISLLFGAYIMMFVDQKDGEDFFTGYFIEKSLSLDNIFVISLVFDHFKIPALYQRRVLFWGISGAVLMRGVMIMAGVELIHLFHPILYFFGVFLVITGLKMLFTKESAEEKTMEDNKLLKLIRRFIPVTDKLHGNRFFIKSSTGQKLATPLFLVLIFIEVADVVFAVDSVPAILAITTDSFVVYTSNIFAILGLRSLYFALSAILHRFEYLKYSLSLVLIFIGSKIFLAKVVEISSSVSLLVTVLLLASGVVYSLYKTRKH